MNCVNCGFDYAYIGIFRVQCVNTECSYYDSVYCDKVIAELTAEQEKEEAAQKEQKRIDEELRVYLYEGGMVCSD